MRFIATRAGRVETQRRTVFFMAQPRKADSKIIGLSGFRQNHAEAGKSVGNLVPVLVHVSTWILHSMLQRSANRRCKLSIVYTAVIRPMAALCNVVQSNSKGTHNPLVGGSNPSGPTILSYLY